MRFTDFVEFIPGIDEAAKQAVRDTTREEKYSKGEVIHMAGKLCNKLYFVEQGLVRSYFITLDGKEVTHYFAEEGHFITTIDSFYQPQPSHYTLQALEDCILQTTTWQEVETTNEKHPVLERQSRYMFMQLLGEFADRMNSLHFMTAPERYQYLMDNHPGLINRAPLGQIASYLGMTQATLSRIRANY